MRCRGNKSGQELSMVEAGGGTRGFNILLLLFCMCLKCSITMKKKEEEKKDRKSFGL